VNGRQFPRRQACRARIRMVLHRRDWASVSYRSPLSMFRPNHGHWSQSRQRRVSVASKNGFPFSRPGQAVGLAHATRRGAEPLGLAALMPLGDGGPGVRYRRPFGGTAERPTLRGAGQRCRHHMECRRTRRSRRPRWVCRTGRGQCIYLWICANDCWGSLAQRRHRGTRSIYCGCAGCAIQCSSPVALWFLRPASVDCGGDEPTFGASLC
jgi:hypothetical protein